ncbi:MAG: primase protein [Candidatus Daviesbacteria bacterium GW2011_GWA1_41_61]|uniref:DNA primase n=1 Tax=Candidatus Daviesbacteria bacterium GW2011_GWA2_40_9 TaxID=1618424 RepID=A0A0G0U6H5_9BACT|nr:MAG: primase protein [Candidatus Daviesbacteria bacterium GW2011_GWC1_40_9]KKR82801.1 MAG: primase protein [Candidatus Daviesbacteria bacterium GW2011_GWA2_40_9]KKR93738.1 MAG: primase protein [Candidatus Daviesbacteria bacterium GW2011_GWB1_41_15]KKS15204.1 MAG: primase protein [Candidatus Daviesbacteria bacterium GW2011_GWA1_41_61]
MDDLDLIKQKINIVDLIQEYLPLKKSGINFKASCPFHQEKTPSFMVSPDRGIWHCFGCQRGGDHFKFLMEKEGLEFTEALEILAKKAGITLKKKAGGEKDKKGRLLEANLKTAQFYHYLLTKHYLGEKALEYLKNRGLEDKTIEEFNLGYAPNSWDSLRNFLIKRGFSDSELIEAGLTVPSKSGSYDRFRGRVVFPLTDLKQQVIGFAGRILDVGEPKYINTPQTSLFDKSNFLFGLNLAKGEIRTKNKAILTEGEMDMILSYQGGIKNVVACKGTAFTLGQIELIKRHTDTILLCFDKDLAGDSASRRGIGMADQAGLNIKVILIPDGKDPAELVLKDPKLWQEAVEKAEDIYDYYLSSVSLRFDPKTAEGKKNIAGEILPIFAKISNSVTLEHYLQKLAALIAVPEDLLRREVKKAAVSSLSYAAALRQLPVQSQDHFKPRREILEEYLMALLFHIPKSLTFVPNFPETLFFSEDYRSLYVLLVLYLDAISFKAQAFEIAEFIKGVSQEMVPLVDRLYLTEIEEKLEGSKSWQEEVTTVISELKKALVKASLEKLSAEIKSAQTFGKVEQLEVLNKRFRDLSLKLKNL